MGKDNTASKFTGGMFANPDSGPAPISPYDSTNQQLQAYLNNMPALYRGQAQGIINNQPNLNELGYQQAQQYGLPTARIQQQIADSNAQAGAASNLGLLQGAGGDVARAATNLSKELNPNYYKVSDASATGAVNLLNSMNLNGLSEGERAAVERSLNQSNYATGNLGLDNATNAVQNAMSYGDRMSGKRAEYASMLGAANNTLTANQQNNPINTTALGLGTSQTNTGNITSFGMPNTGFATNDVMSGIPQMISGASNQQNQLLNEYNKWNSDRGKLDSWAQNMGGMCCFIFLEATNGKLPWYVRAERDYYYQQEPAIANGYKKMAKWLVPLMRDHSWIKKLVNMFMVLPLTHVGGYNHMTNNTGWLLSPVKKLWFNIWKTYGTC